jgi:hypothetical protein
MPARMFRFASIAILLCANVVAPAADQPTAPPFVQRARPGPGQQSLQALAGRWKVEKSLYVAVGTADHPALSETMTTERVWIGDGRFLQDTTRGTIGGQPYFRTGLLGYNNMEHCFEWVTADAFTPILMIYRGSKNAGPKLPASLEGKFTDLGVLGESNVGKVVPMRTVMRIADEDHHEFDIYFAPAGGKEILADKMVFTRVH